MIDLELLSPARNADIGIEAIRHGADAVYIGAPSFGARSAAGNSIEDIKRLVDFAHQFHAKIYVTVNTIIRDDELEAVEKLIWQLYEIHVDALIVQDMGLMRLNLPPIPLHASTQMDNRTPEKICFLYKCGFRQVVLARELSLKEIAEIQRQCPEMKLEVFVHGALCVSMSGQCYASEAMFGRSANRGECAQVCRMEFDLIEQGHDNHGQTTERTVLKNKHLLSLKDMCQINSLQKLIEAGATSFKIEGRLKDLSYVKNVTAAYNEALNQIVRSMPEQYSRASEGKVMLKFSPDVSKSFNRGFTSYFLYGRNDRIFSFDTPKSLGEEVGYVKEIFQNCFTVAGLKPFSNGDGLCFIDQKGKLMGFRVNKVDKGRLYPLEMPRNMLPKMKLYRNFDKRFEDLLSKESAERFIPVDISIDETASGFVLKMNDDYGNESSIFVDCEKELARTHQSENIERQLSKLGGTIYQLRSLNILYKKNWFIPSSLLSEWRRSLAEQFTNERSVLRIEPAQIVMPSSPEPLSIKDNLTYTANIMNLKARSFYEDMGFKQIDWAYEQTHQKDVPVMFCKHCIKYAMGWCAKRQELSDKGQRIASSSRLFLQLANNGRFRPEFDCKNCMMLLYKE